MAKIVRYTGSGEWSALYVDGKLVQSGDHCLVEDKIAELLGVKEVQSDDFLRGGDSYSDVAETLDDIENYRERHNAVRKAKLTEADRLQAEAYRLLEESRCLRDEANETR